MSTYAIGDIQGCFDPLMRLLDSIQYSENKDTLWFTGDLVNRGPKSLETVRFIKSLKNCVAVLGNHDLGMLAVARGAEPYLPNEHTFSDILAAPDKEELLLFLEQLPLLHHDPILGYTMVHAGFHPAWDLALALNLAKEVETILKSDQKLAFYHHLYGNTPDFWTENLSGLDRARFIINCLTRLRFVSPEGKLNLVTKGTAQNPPPGFFPWYTLPNRKSKNLNVVFGHWAALNGETTEKNVFALDTGCAHGHSLTAMRLEDKQRFQVGCL